MFYVFSSTFKNGQWNQAGIWTQYIYLCFEGHVDQVTSWHFQLYERDFAFQRYKQEDRQCQRGELNQRLNFTYPTRNNSWFETRL